MMQGEKSGQAFTLKFGLSFWFAAKKQKRCKKYTKKIRKETRGSLLSSLSVYKDNNSFASSHRGFVVMSIERTAMTFKLEGKNILRCIPEKYLGLTANLR